MRGDDGVGPIVAEQVEAALNEHDRSRCRVLTTHQLLPELALELSQATYAILIDARIPQGEPIGEVRVEATTPEETRQSDMPDSDAEASLTHHWTFPRLLAISKMLYGHAPIAHTVSVSANDFEHTDTLSPAIRIAVPVMCDAVFDLLRNTC